MPVYLKPGELKVKDDGGNYSGLNIFAQESVQEVIESVQEVIDSIPPDYTELTGEVDDIKSDLTQTSNTLLQAISSESEARAAADNALRSDIDDGLAELQAQISSVYGAPLTAETVAEMTDHRKAYVYTGEESGYTAGNWYYWNGSAWVSGGVYNAVAVETDDTLTIEGMPADAEKVGDELRNGKVSFSAGVFPVNVIYNRANNASYNFFQGGCCCNNNIIIAFTNLSDSANITLREYVLSDFSLVRESQIAVGHANDITCDGEYIYITDTGSTIKKYNYSDLSLVSETSTTDLLHAIAINESGNLVGVSANPTTVHEYSLPDMTEIRSKTLALSTKHGYGNIAIESHDNQLYVVLSAPSTVYVFDSDYDLVKIMDAPERLDRITLMESEFIAYAGDNNFLIGWNSRLSRLSTVCQNTITRTDFKVGEANNEENNISELYSPNRKIEVFVDKNYSGIYSDGSSTYPFQEIQQVLNNVNQAAGSLVIRCKEGTYDILESVGKIFEVLAWSGQNIKNVIINGAQIVGGCAIIGQAKVTNNSSLGYGLVIEGGGRAIVNSDDTYDYTVRVTSGGEIVFQNAQMPVNGPAGTILLNSAKYNSTSVTKNTSATKVLGRVTLYSNSSVPSTITLSQNAVSFVLLEVVLNVAGRRFRGFISPNTNTVVPFSYYDSSLNHYHGVLFMGAPTDATFTGCKVEGYKTTSAGVTTSFAPSSVSIEINGIL